MDQISFRLRRWTAFLLGTAFAFQPLMTRAEFRDVSSSSYRDAIASLEAAGVLEGYDDGTFRPEATINRAEFLKIVLLSAYSEAEIDELLARVRVSSIDDVPGDAWFHRYVTFARSKGVVEGYPDGLFHPEREINFVEAAKIISLVYQQKSVETGGEWYEPYARALDASKAIPTSVQGLDRPITRGEMAEMMWRIREEKTDRPAKGYLNLKYPEARVNFASDDVQNATSCADLQALAEETQSRQSTMYYNRGVMLQDNAGSGPVPPMAANQEKSATASPQSGGGADGDFSTTNVQVEGVDEGDIVKTDGEYLYILHMASQTVRIVKAVPASGLREVSMIDFSSTDGGINPTDLYLDGDRLVVLGQEWKQYPYPGRPVPLMEDAPASSKMIAPGYYPPYYSKPKAVVRIYDISDRTKPSVSRTLSFDGSAVSSRKIGDKVYLVLQQPMVWAYPMPLTRATEEDLLPKYTDSSKGGDEMPVTRCGMVTILPHPTSPEYITVATVPLTGRTQEVKQEVVVGSAQNIYASLENLYVAMTEWNYVWDARGSSSDEKTSVYRFAFTDDGVEYSAKGSVPGRILNQFSMDEHDQTFRIATTVGSPWDENDISKNNLYILNRDMNRVGSVLDMAPGEQIYSVRFMGDRAYVVTFKTVDPLFVIDTSDSRNPKILGKLKIPGYSNYLHPYDENHIIGFGKEATESKDGKFAWYQGMKVALFDVTDPTDPKEKGNVIIGDRGTDSPLLYDHKALLFDKERGFMAFPFTEYRLTEAQKQSKDEGREYGQPVYQGAIVFDISTSGLKERGRITHHDDDAFVKAGDYWYDTGRDVQRIVRIGETLYSFSNAEVQANALDDLDEAGSVELRTIEQKTY